MQQAAIDIRPDQAERLKLILRRHLPRTARVYAFGSRAKWTAKEYSDLDLAIDAGRALRLNELSALAEALEQASFPWHVDVVDVHSITPSFRQLIEHDRVLFLDLATEPITRGFRRTILGEVIELKRGYDLPSNQRSPGQVPIVSSSGPSGFHSTAMARGPGVVAGRYGTIGHVYYIESDYWPLNTTLYVRDFRGNNPRYVYYLLKTLDWHQFSDKSSVPGVNRNHVHEAIVTIADRSEQNAIAHILGTLDDKIELNGRMSEALEAMARALFKSWFVDFDPVRAKAEGRETGLSSGIAKLFPDRLDETELGDIPRGWGEGRFEDVVDQIRDQENPLASPTDLFQHFSIPAFDEGQWPKLEAGDSIRSVKSRVPPGVVLLSKLNPEIERVWLPDIRTGERAICSTEFLVLRPKRPFTRTYAYCLARSPIFRQQIEGLVTGTSKSHQRAQADAILNLTVLLPPHFLIEAFDKTAFPLLERTQACRRECRTLAALRDTLLPKLVSGEIRVKDAERFAARAGAL